MPITDLITPVRLEAKQSRLFEILKPMGRVMVAFSGGADSAYLAWAATQTLGRGALAVTADSPSFPRSHKRDAEDFTARFGIVHEFIDTNEFDNPDYVRNHADRCFHCKDELFTRLEQFGRQRAIGHIVYGVNMDDLAISAPLGSPWSQRDYCLTMREAQRTLRRLLGTPLRSPEGCMTTPFFHFLVVHPGAVCAGAHSQIE